MVGMPMNTVPPARCDSTPDVAANFGKVRRERTAVLDDVGGSLSSDIMY